MKWTDVVQVIEAILGIGTFIFARYVFIQARRLKNAASDIAASSVQATDFSGRFDRHKGEASSNPWVLSVNLLENQPSSLPEIGAFYRKALGRERPEARELSLPGINKIPDDIATLIDRLHEERVFLDQILATEVHLFFAGPVSAALHAGSVLNNWKIVKLFQWNRDKGLYEFWGTLQK